DFIRVYLTKGLSTLNECIQNPSAVAVIMGNMHFFRKEKLIRFSVLFARPFGRMHDLETLEFSDLNDAKGWVRFVVLDRRDGIELSIATHWFSKKLLPYSISKFDENTLTPEIYDAFVEAILSDGSDVKIDPNEESFSKENGEHPEFKTNDKNDTSSEMESSPEHEESPTDQNSEFSDNSKSLDRDTAKDEISSAVNKMTETKNVSKGSLPHPEPTISETSSMSDLSPPTQQVFPSPVVKEEVGQEVPDEFEAHDNSSDQVEIKVEEQDENLIAIIETPKKRHRRTQRETYAYLNQLPKRRTRQQSQSEWNLSAEVVASSSSPSPSPKTQIEKSREDNYPQSNDRNSIRNRGNSVRGQELNRGTGGHRRGLSRGMRRGRGRGRGREASKVLVGTRRSERHASKKTKIEFVNEYGLVTHIKTEEVDEHIHTSEISDGKSDDQYMMELDQPTTENEDETSSISSEVSDIQSEDDKESNVGSSGSRAVTNSRTSEPKGFWESIKNTLFGWSPFGSGGR
ncbi:16327_t:CDS:2, partial [Acaulospora morrowiae]